MAMEFYQVEPSSAGYPDRWFLGEPYDERGQEIDSRLFTYGRPYTGPRPRRIVLGYAGREAQMNFADVGMLVVSGPIVRILRRVAPAAMEAYPVAVEDADQEYYIINVVCLCECLDESRSEIMRWTAAGGRPDKVGQYRMVINLTIDTAKANGLDLFRIRGWVVPIIVSGRLRALLEREPDLGVSFDPVG